MAPKRDRKPAARHRYAGNVTARLSEATAQSLSKWAKVRDKAVGRALVFTRTKRRADTVVRGLVAAGIAAEAIHGNKSQNNRDRTLAGFRDGRLRTLVATDIAARGIDVDGISHVVNFDLPDVAETYVHRIGRTGRAQHRARWNCRRGVPQARRAP
jgi:superfamily II DNA/RNA helicase